MSDAKRRRLRRLIGLLALFLLVLAPRVVAEGDGGTSSESAGPALIFSDGFEAGNYFSWSKARVGSSDTTPPDLSIVSPARVLYNDPSPSLEFSFSDTGDGIAPGSFKTVLDGVDLTPSCTVTASTASCPPPILTPGAHPLSATVWDLAGNRRVEDLTVHLVEDTIPPDLSITEPIFEILYRPQVEIRAGFLDFGSGIVRNSFLIQFDGVDITPTCGLSFTSALCDSLVLTPGPHVIQVEIEDAAGNRATATHNFSLVDDGTPPSLTISRPENRTYVNDPPTLIRFQYLDTEAGVDPQATAVLLDGVDISATCRRGTTSGSCSLENLPDAEHLVEVQATDFQGNLVQVSVPFRTATNTGPPQVTFLEPAEGELVTQTPVTLRFRVVDDNALDSVFFDGERVTLVGDELTLPLDLPNGAAQHQVWAEDEFGRRGQSTLHFEVDLKPPTLNLREPLDGTLVNQPQVRVRGTTSDSNGPIVVTVAGTVVPVQGVWFEALVNLVPGENSIAVTTTDGVGHSQQKTLTVTWIDPPKVAITHPLADTLILGESVTVLGTVSDAAATVSVNGVVAVVTGGSFVAENIPLAEGSTVLTAEALSGSGLLSTASVSVLRDLLPPRLSVYSPESLSTVAAPTVAVSGLVNDIVPGTVTGADVTVTVNGLPAEVANRSFLALDVPLTPGSNLLEVVATDTSGNTTRRQLFVTREESPGERLEVVAGNTQAGEVRTALAIDLRVRVTDADGLGAEGQHVVFEVFGNDGSFPGGLRRVSRVTDTLGEASVGFTLGGRAGAGLPIVQVRSPALAQTVTFVATATPGPPAHLIADAGSNQVGITEQPLAGSLVATVTDADFNRLPGISARFLVVEGSGAFADASTDRIVTTDGSGRAVVALTLGPEDGFANNVVEVTLPDFPEILPVGFFASGRAAGLPAETTITGVVLDNTDQAVAGVTVSLPGTARTTSTDAAGYFEFTAAPVGLVHLLVDGSTTSRAGTWPSLDFELVSVPGRRNRLPAPIYLLPIDTARGLTVSEVEGGILELPEVPGLTLEIEPGSVSFPDGSRSGVVSMTAVHSDKVPMPPSFGQQPRLVVTIQPAGAYFDPPARLSLPNTDSLPPGAVTELYSFDHDLGRFVSIGPGTVSEDGTTIISNPGVGILKAGWHCGGNPAPTGTPHDCPVCKECSGIRCVPARICQLPLTQRQAPGDLFAVADCDCENLDPCIAIKCNGAGECVEDEEGPDKEVRNVSVTVEGQRDFEGEYNPSGDLLFEVRVVAKNCLPAVKINFGDGISRSASSAGQGLYTVSHGYIRKGIYDVTAEAYCPECQNQAKKTAAMAVDLYEAAIKLEAGETTISEDGKYTEDTIITATAVKKRDGSTIGSFMGTVMIEETTPVPIYSQNTAHGAELPSFIQLTSGSGEVLARSLAESPDRLREPPPATIETKNYPLIGGSPLEIEQWVRKAVLDPLRATGSAIDWAEARTRDIFDQATGDVAQVLVPIVSYSFGSLDGEDAGGKAIAQPDGTTVIEIDPFIHGRRIDGPGSNYCGHTSTKNFTEVVLHEARHGYQWSLSLLNIGRDDLPNRVDNDDDQDFLVDLVPVPPPSIIVDSSIPRTVCNDDAGIAVPDWTYQGDAAADSWGMPGYVLWARQQDAVQFATTQSSSLGGNDAEH